MQTQIYKVKYFDQLSIFNYFSTYCISYFIPWNVVMYSTFSLTVTNDVLTEIRPILFHDVFISQSYNGNPETRHTRMIAIIARRLRQWILSWKNTHDQRKVVLVNVDTPGSAEVVAAMAAGADKSRSKAAGCTRPGAVGAGTRRLLELPRHLRRLVHRHRPFLDSHNIAWNRENYVTSVWFDKRGATCT